MEDEGTRLQLIETAERLFARQGLDAVSLREINRAAGQRNTAAIHYHFGSKMALVEAILSLRMKALNARRLTLIDALGSEPTLHEVISALVQPLADYEDEAGGRYYIQFLAQIYSDPRVDIVRLIRGKYDQGMQRVFEHVMRLLPRIPPAILAQRFVLQTGHMIYALADRGHLPLMQLDKASALDDAVFVSNLVDTIAGALSAPVSERTQELLAACAPTTS